MMRVNKVFLFLIGFVLLFSCKRDESDPFVTYIIKKGNHYTEDRSVGILNSKSLHFKANLDSSCVYTTKNPTNQYDINKLFGFSDCNSVHHENSARFGWNWQNNKLNIFAYCYTNGNVKNQFITSIDLNKEYDYRISTDGNKYVFTLDDKTIIMDRGCSDNFSKNTRLKLYPYFGGDETAPHDIKILIKLL